MYRHWLQLQYAIKPISYLPITFFKRVVFGKDPYWRQYFFNKWGFPPRELAHLVKGRKTIWIDVLGGGEVTQIVTFTKLLRERYPEYRIVLSTNNYRPFLFAKKLKEIDFVFDIPWDLSLVMRRVVHLIRPEVFIVIDQVRFPIILREAKRMGIKTVLISAALSNDYHKSDYMKRAVAFNFFDYFDLIGVTEPRDKEAYLKLGAGLRRVHITGNMKYDLEFLQVQEEDKKRLRGEIGVSEEDFVFVAGSVHIREEKILLGGYQAAKKHIPGLKMLLVPRYMQHVPGMITSLQKLGIPYVRRSQREDIRGYPESVMLVDTFGELSRLYSIASAMFIGNSLFPRDHFALGQNIIEPIIHTRPIFFGKHMNKWRVITDELLGVWPGLQIHTEEDLTRGLIHLKQNPDLTNRIHQKCVEIVDRNKDGIKNNLDLVSAVIEEKPFLKQEVIQ